MYRNKTDTNFKFIHLVFIIKCTYVKENYPKPVLVTRALFGRSFCSGYRTAVGLGFRSSPVRGEQWWIFSAPSSCLVEESQLRPNSRRL